jgi:hypothetical protein
MINKKSPEVEASGFREKREEGDSIIGNLAVRGFLQLRHS